ncbi:MAG: chemotaxis protein [Gallionellaceae bacterium]|nr:chemotaxis protein [Gallionellaceae bacterium]
MTYLQTVLILLGLLAGWLLVRAAARRFAERHPEFGAAHEEGEGCGCGNHKCGTDQCKREAH